VTDEKCKVKDADALAERDIDLADSLHRRTHRRNTRGCFRTWPLFIFRWSLLILLSFSWSAESVIKAAEQPKRGTPPINDVRSFLQKHCHDCHGDDDPEAGFRIDTLSAEFDQRDSFSRWLKLFHKIDSGEMPPKDAASPPQAELEQMSNWLKKTLVDADRRRLNRDGRVVLRRLNRYEYEQTIRDLFAINVDLKELLPEDSTSHGFDNIGESLNVSSVLMERYLETADVALDAAIVTGLRPETKKKRYFYLDEKRVNKHKSYKQLDDAVVFFSNPYSPTEIRQFQARTPGQYRVRVSAYAHQSDAPVAFRIYGEDARGSYLGGYFDAGQEPTVVELTMRLAFRKTVKVVPYGTRISKWNDAVNEKGPGLAAQWVEIEGPLYEQWPPESQRRVFGDLPIEVVNSAEMKKNRRLEPLREVVSSDPQEDVRAILSRLLPKMFRRPVSDNQMQTYLSIVLGESNAGVTFHNAVRYGLKAALCSPEFLYLNEQPESGHELDDFQLAARLSYFLWSTLPDDELLRVAGEGKLRDPAVLHSQTERLLNDSRSVALTKNFLGQWLELREIDETSPDKILYPEFDELLKVSMARETELFFEELLKHDLSVLNFIDSDFTIINERLARHYGIDDVRGQEFRRVLLGPESHRGGVMTQASVLKVSANGTNTSPVLRGMWLLEKILGDPVPPPPANVPAVEPDIRGATSIRDQIAMHRQNESCAVCHRKIDPAGFALENFDVIGGWREHYRSVGEGERVAVEVNGRNVRYKRGPAVDAGDVLSDGRRFSGIDGFKELLLEDKGQIARGIAKNLLTYSTGGPVQFSDADEVTSIVQHVAGKDYGMRSLIHEVVQSRIFRKK
jgi:hypothetical protein